MHRPRVAYPDTARESALAGPDGKPIPFTATELTVTAVRDPAESGMPAAPPQPPAGDGPTEWTFTTVTDNPVAVGFGPDPPGPLIMHETAPAGPASTVVAK